MAYISTLCTLTSWFLNLILTFVLLVVKLLEFLKVDDPVGCVGVHWGGGFVACITTGLFAEKGDRNSNRWNGVFRKGSGELLAWNLLGAVVVTAWSFGLTAIVVS